MSPEAFLVESSTTLIENYGQHALNKAAASGRIQKHGFQEIALEPKLIIPGSLETKPVHWAATEQGIRFNDLIALSSSMILSAMQVLFPIIGLPSLKVCFRLLLPSFGDHGGKNQRESHICLSLTQATTIPLEGHRLPNFCPKKTKAFSFPEPNQKKVVKVLRTLLLS